MLRALAFSFSKYKKTCILENDVIYYFGNRSDGRSIRTGWCMLVASY